MIPKTPPLSREKERELRDRVLADPHAVWGDFQREYDPLIRRLVQRFGIPPEDREEVYQEICHSVIKNDYRVLRVWDAESCSLRHFLAIVATNAAINFLRSAFHSYSRRKAASIDSDAGGVSPYLLLEDTTQSPLERLQRIQAVEVLEKGLSRWVQEGSVRREDRILISFRLQGMSFQEVAGAIGITPANARARFARLKPKLRRLLAGHGVDGVEGPRTS